MLISNGNSLSPGLSEYVGDGQVVKLPRADDPEFGRAVTDTAEIEAEVASGERSIEDIAREHGRHLMHVAEQSVHLRD